VPNSFGENVCENANTRALSGLHVVVLAHLLRRWSLRGGEVLGITLPPAELARRDLVKFGRANCTFQCTGQSTGQRNCPVAFCPVQGSSRA
jgi:hypothetical protein